MPPRLLVLQIFLAVLLGAALLGLPILRFCSGADSQRCLYSSLGVFLGDETSKSAWFVTLVANYAYLLGFLFSLGGRLAGARVGIIISRHAAGNDVSEAVRLARVVVGMAFDSGRAERFSWPPAPASLQDVLGSAPLTGAG
jgi:hypothetical protein